MCQLKVKKTWPPKPTSCLHTFSQVGQLDNQNAASSPIAWHWQKQGGTQARSKNDLEGYSLLWREQRGTSGFCCLWFLANAMGLGHTTFDASPLRNIFSTFANMAKKCGTFHPWDKLCKWHLTNFLVRNLSIHDNFFGDNVELFCLAGTDVSHSTCNLRIWP